MTTEFQGIFLILGIAVLAPLASRLPLFATVPVVAIELMLGVLAGPSVTGLVVNDAAIEFLGRFGLVFLFFQAGFEFKMKELGPGPLRIGLLAWLVSMLVSALFVAALYLVGLVRAPALVAIILPTTAFGILLPILRQAGELTTDFGRYVMGAAAIGELGPLLLASIALAQEKHHFHQTLLSLLFLLIAVVSVFLLATLRSDRLSAIILRWLGDSELLPVRVSLLVLLGFVSLAGVMGMEAVVGAYAAGMAVATLVDGTRAQALEGRLKTIGAGFFVPVFSSPAGSNSTFPHCSPARPASPAWSCSPSPLLSFAWRRSRCIAACSGRGTCRRLRCFLQRPCPSSSQSAISARARGKYRVKTPPRLSAQPSSR
ncbi:cation:proton antiporter [Methylocystis sp. IM2]|uniref:cation:proton antiporter n=1 Tax=Methylocystis sp. IM2 TaxID=3136563 RepID=UPI0030F5F515